MTAKPLLTGQVALQARLRAKLQALATGVTAATTTQLYGARMLRRTQERFRKQVDPDNAPWKKLEDSTKRKGPPRQGILWRTGALYKSLHVVHGDIGAEEGIRANLGIGVRIGSDAQNDRGFPYGRVHQLGNHHVPQRRFLGVNANDIRSLVTMAQALLAGKKVRP